MSTRSGIAIKENDGTYTWIYVHADGYPAGVGRTLLDHYNDRETINKLMQLGDLSWLGENPDDPGDLWERRRNGIQHDDWAELYQHCCSYASRGENCKAETGLSIMQLNSRFIHSDRAYLYKWDEKQGWKVKEKYVDRRWRSLKKAVERDEKETAAYLNSQSSQ